MNSLPLDVILAIVLVDLPIDIDNKETPEKRTGFGESWWFITCDCDDHYVEVVDQIVGICSVAQVRELACMENSAGESLLGRAAPESKEILQCSLRFLGRFEIRSELALSEDAAPDGVTLFEAVDFGYPDDALVDGIDVFLKFFPNNILYTSEVRSTFHLRGNQSIQSSQSLYCRRPLYVSWTLISVWWKKYLHSTLATLGTRSLTRQSNFACA